MFTEYNGHVQCAFMHALSSGVASAQNDLKYSLDKLDDLNCMVEELIASSNYPDLEGAYRKGILTPKSNSEGLQENRLLYVGL